MAVAFGATIFTNTYPNQSGRVAASNQFDAYLGAPWALTWQKVYYPEGQWPANINDINPVGNMAAAGIKILVCVKPLRTMTVAEYNNLVAFIALLQANAVTFEIVLWNEANGHGANGDFPSGAAYTAYVNFYIGALRAAGVTSVYVPALYTPSTVATWYPGDANVDKILIDYYLTDFLYHNATLGTILTVAANHSGGPCPVGLGEFGMANSSKFPKVSQLINWLVTQLQIPFLTYLNQGGTLDKFLWYDAGAGANQIDNTTPGSQLTAMLNFQSVLTGATPVGQITASPDYPDFQSPQANADSIATTGAPLLALHGSALGAININVAGGASVAVPNLPITQLGYAIQVSASIGNAATVPFVNVDFAWTDPVSGIIVAEEKYMIPCANSAAVNTFNFTGPTKSGALTVSFANQDPAVTAAIAVVVLTNSCVYVRDRVLQTASNAMPVYNIAGGHQLHGVIASWSNQAILAGNNRGVLLPLYAGDVSIYVDQTGNTAANAFFTLQAYPTSFFGTASLWSASPAGGVGGGIAQLIRLPRAPTFLTFTNNGGATSTVNMKMIALDEAH